MSKPLAGVSISASHLAGDVEAQIREKTRTMGGEFHHELTPQTEFLVCGKRWTNEYNYAIAHEIALIPPDAFFDAHMRWVKGDELDFRAFLTLRRLAAFENMVLSITNMDTDQRAQFQKFLEAQGATYVPSLSQRVTVLVSSLDRGKKVDGARKWQIPVVAPKWMTDSGKIGAALDPVNYDPGNPRASMEPPLITPKIREQISSEPSGSHQQNNSGEPHTSHSLKRKIPSSGLLAKRMPTSVGATFMKPPEVVSAPATATGAQASVSLDRLFSRLNFSYAGFSERESAILSHTINSLDGSIEHDRPHYVVVKSSQPESLTPPYGAKIITEWSIERSLFHKQLMLDSSWGRPVYAQPCRGFANLRICISGFADMDQRHVTLLIKLLGSEFMETLTADRDLLVASSAQAHKVRYAKSWGVPVVSCDWLWQCALGGTILPISEQHCLDGLGFRPAPHRDAPSESVRPAVPKPSNMHLKIGRIAASRSSTLGSTTLTTSADTTRESFRGPARGLPARESTHNESTHNTHNDSAHDSATDDLPHPEPPHAEVQYREDDASEKAQILLAMGERPPTPPPAEPRGPTIRSTISSRLRRR